MLKCLACFDIRDMLISILVHLLKYWLLLGNYFRSLSIDRNSVNEKQVVLKLRRLPGITAYVHSSILAVNWFQQALYDDGLWIIDQVRKCFDSILKSSVGEKKVNQFSYFIIIHDFWINKMVINVNNRKKNQNFTHQMCIDYIYFKRNFNST